MQNKQIDTPFFWRKLTALSVLMMCVPCYFWLSDYHWTLPQHIGRLNESQFWIVFTQIGSTPYAVITALIFIALLLILTRKTYAWRSIFLLCALSLASTQALQVGLKHVFAEPRPYVVQMQQNHDLDAYQVNAQTFYQLDKSERAKIVSQRATNHDERVVTAYQATELNYSFPSGHTIFAVSWLLLAAGLGRVRHKMMTIFQAALTLWAAAILYSRVWLGMHYPIDLFVSILLAWAVHLILFRQFLPRFERSFRQP